MVPVPMDLAAMLECSSPGLRRRDPGVARYAHVEPVYLIYGANGYTGS